MIDFFFLKKLSNFLSQRIMMNSLMIEKDKKQKIK